MNYRMRVASIYLLGFFIDLVNMFIANVAYPDIGRRFDASVSLLAWVSNGYILGLTLVIPLSRWLSQRIGAKRLLMLSLIVFMAGATGAGLASSLSQLIAWRWLQGVGGGLLIPVGQTMTYALYRSHERAKLSSAIMLVALLAPALSPTLGGLIVDHISWRYVFLASLPLAGVTLILSALWLKPDARATSPEPLDLSGLIIACSGLTLILLGLTYLGEAGHIGQGGLLLMVGILLMVLFVRHALRKTSPLLNLRLLNAPLLQTAMLVYHFIPGVFTGVSLIAMIYLQVQLGMSATLVGSMMIPWALASCVAITLTGKMFNHVGPRPLFIIGCLGQGAGIALLTLIGHAEDISLTGLAYLLMGFGSSLCSSTAQSAAFIDIAEHDLADASALWNINRQLSFCLGVAVMGLLLNLMLSAGVPTNRAFPLCFLLAAGSVIIPVLYCLRLPNRSLVFTLNKEKK
ncbi:MFS transporter [Pseudescherichia vulneris]|uniref:MFS transporter n=1 Tax=Pseudescherichia vulneris TaxID=566 RepID=UPI0028A6BAC1|nr:MFS transporter [Pseudescherichia vulneris]